MKQRSHLRLVYSRGAATSTANSTNVGTNIARLHPAIQDLISRHQLLLAPVCTHSRYATLKPLCDPTYDFYELAAVAPENCNWVVQIGLSLVVVEINIETGRDALAFISAQEPEGWSDTLQFGDAMTRFLLFRRPEQRLRFFGNRLRGIKVHAKESGLIQVPPSWFVSGTPLKWVNPNTKILAAPSWLQEDQKDAA